MSEKVCLICAHPASAHIDPDPIIGDARCDRCQPRSVPIGYERGMAPARSAYSLHRPHAFTPFPACFCAGPSAPHVRGVGAKE